MEFSWGMTMKCFLLGQNPTVGWRFPQAGLAWVFWGTGRTTEEHQWWVCPWGVWGAQITPLLPSQSQLSHKVTGNSLTPNPRCCSSSRDSNSSCGAAGGSSWEQQRGCSHTHGTKHRDQNPPLISSCVFCMKAPQVLLFKFNSVFAFCAILCACKLSSGR